MNNILLPIYVTTETPIESSDIQFSNHDGILKAHGRGTVTLQDGCTFEGVFIHGLLEGRGIVRDQKGTSEWEFNNGLPQGKGTITFENGDRYNGHWNEGVEPTEGTMIYINGDHYDGYLKWINGELRRHGEGTMKYRDDPYSFMEMYQGMWQNDSPSEGEMTYRRGSRYPCIKYSGLGHHYCGTGIAQYKNGQIYEGTVNSFQRGLVYRSPSDDTWDEGKVVKVGQGVLYDGNGLKFHVSNWMVTWPTLKFIITVPTSKWLRYCALTWMCLCHPWVQSRFNFLVQLGMLLLNLLFVAEWVNICHGIHFWGTRDYPWIFMGYFTLLSVLYEHYITLLVPWILITLEILGSHLGDHLHYWIMRSFPFLVVGSWLHAKFM